MQAALTRPADGYTLSYSAMNMATIIASGQAQGLKKEDMLPMACLCSDQSTIGVLPDSKFQSMEDIIKYSKDNPGKLLFGGAQSKGTAHVLSMLIEKYSGVKFNYMV